MTKQPVYDDSNAVAGYLSVQGIASGVASNGKPRTTATIVVYDEKEVAIAVSPYEHIHTDSNYYSHQLHAVMCATISALENIK